MFGSHLEVLLESSFYDDRCASCQFYHLRIAYPIWGRYDDFVAGIDKCHDGVADALLGTVLYKYLVDGIVKSVFVFEFFYDGLAQISVSRYW